MKIATLEQGLELKKLGEDVYESIQQPWTWHGVSPAGRLQSLRRITHIMTEGCLSRWYPYGSCHQCCIRNGAVWIQR